MGCAEADQRRGRRLSFQGLSLKRLAIGEVIPVRVLLCAAVEV